MSKYFTVNIVVDDETYDSDDLYEDLSTLGFTMFEIILEEKDED